MTIALIIIGSFVGLAASMSALGKLSKKPDVMGIMEHVGVKSAQIPLLAVLELLGALGILVGIWSKPLGVAATIGLSLYFLGAVGAHLKVKDVVKDVAPACSRSHCRW
jgi:uncharacterized membrane protein YphA (DoxX/SURF4 family)